MKAHLGGYSHLIDFQSTENIRDVDGEMNVDNGMNFHDEVNVNHEMSDQVTPFSCNLI